MHLDMLNMAASYLLRLHSFQKTAARELVRAAPAQPQGKNAQKIGESCACTASKKPAARELVRAAPAQPQETAARKLVRAAPAQPPETADRKLLRAAHTQPPANSCQKFGESCACTASGKQLPENPALHPSLQRRLTAKNSNDSFFLLTHTCATQIPRPIDTLQTETSTPVSNVL